MTEIRKVDIWQDLLLLSSLENGNMSLKRLSYELSYLEVIDKFVCVPEPNPQCIKVIHVCIFQEVTSLIKKQ